jgi:hypothetical protein
VQERHLACERAPLFVARGTQILVVERRAQVVALDEQARQGEEGIATAADRIRHHAAPIPAMSARRPSLSLFTLLEAADFPR